MTDQQRSGVDDFLGQPVRVGDQVVFMLGGFRHGRREMTQGKVLRIGKGTITVRYFRVGTGAVQAVVKLDFVRVPDNLKNPRLDTEPT